MLKLVIYFSFFLIEIVFHSKLTSNFPTTFCSSLLISTHSVALFSRNKFVFNKSTFALPFKSFPEKLSLNQSSNNNSVSEAFLFKLMLWIHCSFSPLLKAYELCATSFPKIPFQYASMSPGKLSSASISACFGLTVSNPATRKLI